MPINYINRYLTSPKLKNFNTISISPFVYDDRFGTGLPVVECNLRNPGHFVFEFFEIGICVQVDGILCKKSRYNLICFDGISGEEGIKEEKYNITHRTVSKYLKTLKESNDVVKLKSTAS